MEYYVIERGGVEFYKRFLNNPEIGRSWVEESDFGSFKKAWRFTNVNEAHQIVRENEGEFQGRVIRTGKMDLWEPIYDKR